MQEIKVKVYAKINLDLKIKGTYDDGYHKLDMLMTSIDIYDIVFAKKSLENVVTMDGKVQDDNNTAKKALNLLELAYGYSMRVDIKKNIPFSAGLGGSSADASAVFYCYSKLYGIELESMHKLAMQVGADVVYMLYGGAKHVRCKGEMLSLAEYSRKYLVIAQKEVGASTKEVYNLYDKILNKDNYIENDLQSAAISLCPSILYTINDLKKYSNKVYMTGSGSAVVAEFDDMKKANNCADSLKDYLFKKALITKDIGIEII